MKRLLFLVCLVLSVGSAAAVTYYEAMYQPAGGAAEPYVPAPDLTAGLPEPEPEPVAPDTSATAKTAWVAATLPLKVTRDAYVREDGTRVGETYHVVVGSFNSKVNALRMAEGLRVSGNRPTIAMSSQGLYRVFLMSGDDEDSVRAWLARCRADYPDAWILKIKSE